MKVEDYKVVEEEEKEKLKGKFIRFITDQGVMYGKIEDAGLLGFTVSVQYADERTGLKKNDNYFISSILAQFQFVDEDEVKVIMGDSDDFDLLSACSTRARNTLIRYQVDSLEKLCSFTRDEVRSWHNAGKAVYDELCSIVENHGCKFKFSLSDILSRDTVKALHNCGIDNLSNLAKFTEEEIKEMTKLGKSKMNVLKTKMEQYGYSFKE